MSTTPEVDVIRGLLAAWNSQDLDRIEAFFHPDFENHQMPFEPVIGRDAYLEHCRHWFEAYDEFWMEEVSLVGGGGIACLESRGGGVRKGSFFGLAPSGEPEINHACDVFELRDGLIVMERGYWDFSLLTGAVAPRLSLVRENVKMSVRAHVGSQTRGK